MKRKMAVIILAVMFAGCATHPDKISTAYVSPIQYNNYDCDQVRVELERVTRRANALHNSLAKTANTDSAQMAIGMVLFWPSLLFLEGGDGPEAAEYARLKGERDTLEKIAIQKKCDTSIIPKTAETDKEPKTVEIDKVPKTVEIDKEPKTAETDKEGGEKEKSGPDFPIREYQL